jgi:hypothetical protein
MEIKLYILMAIIGVFLLVPASEGIITHAGDITIDSSITYINISGFNQTYYTLNSSGMKIGVNLSAVQARVNYSCAAGSSIRIIAEDGTVTCENDDAGAGSYDLNITADSGIANITDTQVLIFHGSPDISTSISGKTLTIDYNGTASGSDTNASTACAGTTTYLDGEGNCDDISGVYVQAATWTTIDNYPASCPANQYVQAIGDTLTCINVVNDTQLNQSAVWNYVNVSNFFSIDCDKLDGESGAYYLDNTDAQTLSFDVGTNITITGGNSIDISAIDTDTNTQLTPEEVEDMVGGMLGGTETHISVDYQDAAGNIDFVVSDDWWDSCEDAYVCGWWNENDDIAEDEISESKINFTTACAAGDYYRLNGNDLECTTPPGGSDDQTLSFDAGTNITIEDGNSIDISAIDTDTDTHLTGAEIRALVGNWSGNMSHYWNADGDIDNYLGADEISESNIAFVTVCAAGDYYRLSGNDLECTTPTDTDSQTLSFDAGTNITITGGNSIDISAIDTDTNTQLSQEEVEDFAGGMDQGTETRISVTYNDATGNLDYVVDDMNDDTPDNDGEVPDDITIDSSGKDHKIDDNDKFYFGTGDDACIYFDGSQLVIDASC